MEKKNNKFNLTLNIVLLIIFITIGIIGILIFPGFISVFDPYLYTSLKVILYQYHHWIGLLLITFICIHIYIHRKKSKSIFKLAPLKKIFKKENYQKLFYTNLIILFIFIIISFLTGIIKFPGLIQIFNINVNQIPINEISTIHDNSGIFLIIFTILHLILSQKIKR